MSKLFIIRSPQILERLNAYVQSYGFGDNPLSAWVAPHKEKRNKDQNARYWKAIVTPIAEHAWVNGKQFSAEAWHEQLKGELIGYVDLPNGSRSPMSSADLSVSEFADFMTRAEHYAVTQLGIELKEAA